MELSVQDGCVLWGSRVVIPSALRSAVVQMLHEGHPGTSRMKALARGVVWWPGMDAELRVKSEDMWSLSSQPKVTTTGTIASVGVAVNTFTHRLRGSVPGKNILYCGRRSFQVVGGHPSCLHFFSAGCSSIKKLVLNSWTSRCGCV